MKKVFTLIIGIILLFSFSACTDVMDQLNGQDEANTTFTATEKLVFSVPMNTLVTDASAITGVTATYSESDVELRITATVDSSYAGGGSFSDGTGTYYMRVTKAGTDKYNLFTSDPINGERQELNAVTSSEVIARFTLE